MRHIIRWLSILLVLIRFRPRRPYKSWWKYIKWRIETFTGTWSADIDFKFFIKLTRDKSLRKSFIRYLHWCYETKRKKTK